MDNRVKFKIGEIEFEAEGSDEIVERERIIFLNTILPAAVDAIVRTRGTAHAARYLEAIEEPSELLLEDATVNEGKVNNEVEILADQDLSRTNLASFLKKYGSLSGPDFVLFAAYFDEKKNGTQYFSIENVSKYYAEARKPEPVNLSVNLNRLAQRGLIMDAPNVDQKSPKLYIVSSEGERYIEEFSPKKSENESKVTKPRKARPKPKSAYADITCDDLNLRNYPEVRKLKGFKEKMLMAMYIVTNEKKGEWFTVADVLKLMTDVFGEHVTPAQINGVFTRERPWFKAEIAEGSKKEVKRKLLNKGLEFAISLCEKQE